MCSSDLARVPEPALSMEDPAQVEAFVHSGQPDGLLAPLYFFHAVHSLAAIRPGDRVLDLACGPANQLAQIARLHPQAQFVGVDLSASMLAVGRQVLARQQLHHVSLRQADITRLDAFDDASFDAMVARQAVLAEILKRDPDVISVISTVGGGNAASTVNSGRIFITLRDKPERTDSVLQVIARLRRVTSSVPGINIF